MSPAELSWLFGAGLVAGIVSVVASLASLVSYPALLAVGLPPLAANVTNTVSLVFTGIGSAAGSRPELVGQARDVRRLGWLTAAGGAVGSGVLLLSPATLFEAVAPWLVAGASVVLLVQPRLTRRDRTPTAATDRGRRTTVFAVAVYVGYFGAAGGILMLAALSTLRETSFARTNALKNVLSGFANAVAAASFIAFGPVNWAAVVPLGAGFLLGGRVGPSVVRRLPGDQLRVAVALAGLAVAAKLGYSTYA